MVTSFLVWLPHQQRLRVTLSPLAACAALLSPVAAEPVPDASELPALLPHAARDMVINTAIRPAIILFFICYTSHTICRVCVLHIPRCCFDEFILCPFCIMVKLNNGSVDAKKWLFNHNLTFFSSHFHTFFSFSIFHMAFCIISCSKKGF